MVQSGYTRLLLTIFFPFVTLKGQPQERVMNKMYAVYFKTKETSIKGTYRYANACLNLADYYALNNIKDSAFMFLNEAVNTCSYKQATCYDIYSPDILGSYPFKKWETTEEWRSFKRKIDTGFYALNSELKLPKLAYDLLKAKGRDQTIRYYFKYIIPLEAAKREMKKNDSISVAFMKNIIYKQGFPGISVVGLHASHAAFLLCQHADKDIEFQKKVLEQMKVLLKINDIIPADYAYLTDRVMVKETGVQIFGTQFISKGKLYPIADSSGVDIRRKEIGLSSLADYVKGFVFFD